MAASKLKADSFVSISEPYVHAKATEFEYDIEMRRRDGKRVYFEKIDPKDFIPDRYYRLYVRHKSLGYRRLLGFGKFARLPDRSTWSGKKLGGRVFSPTPLPKRNYKGWIPTWRLAKVIEDEVNQAADELGVEAKSSIIPMRRWFHPKYKLYADKPINVYKRVTGVAISVLVLFVYPDNQWIQKRTIVIDLSDNPQKLSNLHTMEDELQDYIEAEFRFRHPGIQDFGVLKEQPDGSEQSFLINGFIPLEYEPRRNKNE